MKKVVPILHNSGYWGRLGSKAGSLSLVSAFVTAGVAGGCGGDDEDKKDEPIKLTAFTFSGHPVDGRPAIADPAMKNARDYMALHPDITVDVQTETDFAKLMPTIRQKASERSTDFDMYLVSNIWMSDLVNIGYAHPMDTYVNRDKGEFDWDADVPQGVKRKDTFGGHIYSMIVDNDGHIFYYRKDVLGNTQWQNQYQQEKGKALPNPPQTLEEMVEVAQWFEGKDWSPNISGERSFVTNLKAGDQMYWYALTWAAGYAVIPKSANPPAPGLLWFKPDMTPLVSTPGFVEGIKLWKQMVDCCVQRDPVPDRGSVISHFIEGKALMALDWGDIGYGGAANSVLNKNGVGNQIGYSIPPGTKKYYDWRNDQWTAGDSIHNTPVFQFNGWSWFIAGTSAHKDQAWDFIKFAASAAESLEDVVSSYSGFQPWRKSHLTNIQKWVDAGWPREAAEGYVGAILDATDHDNAVLDLRIPGTSDYGTALENALKDILTGAKTVDAALTDCATEHAKITSDLGLDPQRNAYKEDVGIP